MDGLRAAAIVLLSMMLGALGATLVVVMTWHPHQEPAPFFGTCATEPDGVSEPEAAALNLHRANHWQCWHADGTRWVTEPR